MKMTESDYAALSASLDALIARIGGIETVKKYRQEEGAYTIPFIWNMLHASKHPTGPLYRYLKDGHIETALLRYFSRLEI